MKRKQVFVRAKIEVGEKVYWVNADVFDLDEESFRAFVVGMLFRAGAVVGIKDEFIKTDHIEHHVKKELELQYVQAKLKDK